MPTPGSRVTPLQSPSDCRGSRGGTGVAFPFCHVSTSTEIRIPTQTFLLPGQQFCIGLPWERAGLPTHGLPAAPRKPAQARVTLRDEAERADPIEGFELGACRVLRRLADDARTLLAVRTDESDGHELVVLRRLDLPEVFGREVRRHAEWAARFSHPHLARVFDCEQADEGVFWVTQLAPGATLAELAQTMRALGQGVPLGLTLATVLEAARALGTLHDAGAAHGLLRDQALAVTLDGSPRVLDAGLFRCLGQGPSWLEVREVMGPYFAPEQLLEGRLPDPKTDVYALGVVLYEGLTGEPVRRGKTFEQQVKLAHSGTFVPPSRLNVTVGPALDEVLRRALSPERSKRYATAREFASALNEAASAFVWRREVRAQFVARHFPERTRQDEALKELLAALPPRPVAPTPEPVRTRRLVDVAVPQVVLPPLAVAPRPSVKRPARRHVPRRSPLATPALSLAAALLGFLVIAVGVPALRPAPPPPVVAQVAAPVVEPLALDAPAEVEPLEQQVERVMLEAPRLATPALASTEEPLEELAPLAAVMAPVRKTRRVRSAKADEPPLPPWLAKRGRK